MPYCAMGWALSVLGLVTQLGYAAGASPPSVNVSAGTVQGGVCTNNSDAIYFKSIPFAQPPVGDLRFAPPRPYDGRFADGVLDATSAAPACIQFVAQYPPPQKASEDCLYLNVWAPANATRSSSLPVRVWIYGGANQGGFSAEPMYDGCNVPNTDALMVSINYRLGPLGFFALKEAGFGGNQGIQDALLALQWVQDNIAAFGGNPEHVMLHGESAGGLDAFILASLPQAPRLMSAVAVESGPSLSAITQDAAELAGVAFAQNLNCSKTDASCLLGKSVDQLMGTYNTTQLPGPRKFPGLASPNITTPGFNPSLDGTVVPVQPEGQGLKVPSIVGTNSMEGTLFTFSIFENGSGGPQDANSTDYDIFLQENFGPDAAAIKQAYPLSAFNSTPYPAFYAISTVFTDHEFFCPARRALDATTSAGISAWTYLFAHIPKCPWFPGVPNTVFPLLGATHTSEIAFVLGNTAGLPAPNGTCKMSSDEMTISHFLENAWTSMGQRQSPNQDESQWPAYSSSTSLGLNIVNSTVPGKIDYSKCQIWDGIDQKLLAVASNSLSNPNRNTTGNSSPSQVSGSASSRATSDAAGTTCPSIMLILASIVATWLYLERELTGLYAY